MSRGRDALRELVEPPPRGTFRVLEHWTVWRQPCPTAGCGKPVHRYGPDAPAECWDHREVAALAGYCAPARCYCGQQPCPAFASWQPLP